jgi:hypothetical protein
VTLAWGRLQILHHEELKEVFSMAYFVSCDSAVDPYMLIIQVLKDPSVVEVNLDLLLKELDYVPLALKWGKASCRYLLARCISPLILFTVTSYRIS